MIHDYSDKGSCYEPLELDRSQLTMNQSMRKSSIRTESDDRPEQKKLSIVDILTRERMSKI
jgi:hypothetical protein